MIAVVVVSHSTPAATVASCVTSIQAAGGVDRIVVVDNGAGERPLDVPGAEVVRVPNRGYGAAANVGFAMLADVDAIALLNDDVLVRAGWLEPLAAVLEDPRIGAAQPKLLIAGTGRVNSLGVVIGPDGAGRDIGDGEPDAPGGDPSEIDIFTGGAVLLSAAFLAATGGFDERYFLYYEDVDLARRGRELGWRYLVVPASVVDHQRGASTSDVPEITRYLQERNRLWTAFRFAGPATIGRAVWLSLRRVRHRPRRLHLRALCAGVGGGIVRLWERTRRQRVAPADGGHGRPG